MYTQCLLIILPQQPTSFSLETCPWFWSYRNGHERMLMPQTQLASRMVAFPCPPQLYPEPHSSHLAPFIALKQG